MIDTNRLDYKKDLEEVVYLFCEGVGIDIKHFEKNDGATFINVYEFEGEGTNLKTSEDV